MFKCRSVEIVIDKVTDLTVTTQQRNMKVVFLLIQITVFLFPMKRYNLYKLKNSYGTNFLY